MSMKFLKSAASFWKKVSGNVVVKDTSADVGIGTDDPQAKLHVEDFGAHYPVLLKSTDNYNNTIDMDADRSAADSFVGGMRGKWKGTSTTAVWLRTGSDTTNKDDGYITFETAAAGTLAEAMRIESDQDVKISTGNLVVGTAGKGIDFSAQSSPAAGMTSELLDRYEEGTWTPVVSDGTNNATMNSTYEDHYYTRIGRVVYCTGYLATDGMGSVSGGLRITGLPFTVGAKYSASCGAYGSGMVITAGQTVGLRVIPSQTYAYLTIWDATAGTTQLTSTQWNDGAMMISFTYTV